MPTLHLTGIQRARGLDLAELGRSGAAPLRRLAILFGRTRMALKRVPSIYGESYDDAAARKAAQA
jgi:hypothetical protein